MMYLDRKHPNPPLFGRTAEEAGRIFQCISEFSSDFGPSNQRLGRSIFFGPPLGADEAKEVRETIHLSLARWKDMSPFSSRRMCSVSSGETALFLPVMRQVFAQSQQPDRRQLNGMSTCE